MEDFRYYYDRKLEERTYSYRSFGICFVVIILFALLSLLCSCSSVKYVPVESVRTDTVYQSKIQRDSVHVHDSVFVKEWQKGDTVFRDRDRWHTKYVEREVHDTLYQSRVDSIAVPYPVEKELSWWAKKKIEFGELAMLIMAGLLCFVVIKHKIK
jgi:hypothetical protein